MKQILRIDASARNKNSYSRALADKLIVRLLECHPGANVLKRDIYNDCYFLSESMIEVTTSGNNTIADTLIDELLATDILVLAVPVYNFSIPAALKAYIDMVVRSGRTFRYGEKGPQGLVEKLKVYMVIVSN